jgi:predicted permease
MQDLMPIVTSVLGVFLVIGVGAFCRRRGWLTSEADNSLASLAANVFLPAYFIHKIVSSEQFDSILNSWMPPAFGFVATAIGFGVAFLFARTLGPRMGLDTDAKQRAFALCAGICNYGYIPLPLTEKFYPEALVDLILHNVGVDLALWSIGIAIVAGKASGGWLKAVVSPPFLAVIFAVTTRELAWEGFITQPILSAIGAVGNCAIPMGLLLSGAIIVDFIRESNWKGSLGTIFAAIGIRQLLLPILMLMAAGSLSNSDNVRQIMMLQAAMPAAVFPIVLVRLYGRDTETALRVVLATSIAALVLIPIWLAIGKWWLAI